MQDPVVPITVYVVVVVGDAVTELPVLDDSVAAGAHEYVVAPDAVSVVLPLEQIDIAFESNKERPEFTVTVASAKPGQPVPLLPVTL